MIPRWLSDELNSARYESWSRTHAVDSSKVQNEARGTRRPLPRDGYARLLVEALRRAIPPLPDPLPETALDPIWAKDAVFTRSLSSFITRREALEVGFEMVYVQLDHSTEVERNIKELKLTEKELRGRVVGWGTYGQNTDSYSDGMNAGGRVAVLGLAGWVANGELWAEDIKVGDNWVRNAYKTAAFLEGWNRYWGDRPRPPLSFSCLSSKTISYARGFDYKTALGVPGSAIDIQVYGAADPDYTVAAGFGMLQVAGVPRNRIAMTFNVIGGRAQTQDILSWGGPRRIYCGEDVGSRKEFWKELKR